MSAHLLFCIYNKNFISDDILKVTGKIKCRRSGRICLKQVYPEAGIIIIITIKAGMKHLMAR